MDENKPRAFSIEEGVLALRQSREDQAKPEPKEEAEPEREEVLEDQAEPEVEEESEPQDEAEASEDEGDDPEPEDEPESDDDLYEVGGETFTLAELREWKANGLKNADYTQKTQALSEERKAFQAERAAFESDKQAVVDQFTRQQAQLKEALATFATDQDPEPSTEGLSWEEYTKRKAAWDKRQQKKAQAREVYQQIAAQERQELVNRETAALMKRVPEWMDPDTYNNDAKAIVGVAGEYGFSEAEMAQIADHRMVLVLNDLRKLKAEAAGRKTSAEVVAKKAKAARKLTPGAKIDGKNQTSKQLRQSRDQLRKTGSMADAVALLQAKRAAG